MPGITTCAGDEAPGAGAARGARVHLLNLALILLVVLAAFGPSLQYGFVWDDNTLIVGNDYVKSPPSWSSAFVRSFWSIGENVDDIFRSFYRPVISLSYLLDYAVWGLDPRGFHLTNLLMHWLVCCAVYWLALRFLKKPLPALAAAAIFAVHPAHVENVCWISGRTDLFCALFFFLGFGLFLLGTESERVRPIPLGASVVCFGLALLSKETALTLPILVLAYYVILGRGRIPGRRFAWSFAMLATTAVAYLGIRKLVLGEITGALGFGNGLDWIASVCMVLAKYLGLLLLVVPTDPHHGEGFVSLLTVKALVFAIVSVAYVGALGWAYRRREALLVFLLAWIPLALLPVFNLGAFGDVLYADRFLYVPSFGFALALAFLASRSTTGEGREMKGLKIAIAVVYGGIILVMAFLSRSTSSRWASDLTLFEYAARTSPESAYVHVNLGNSLTKAREFDKARRSYETAVSLRPAYVPALFGLGHVLKELGRYREAATVLSLALTMNEEASSVTIGPSVPRQQVERDLATTLSDRLQKAARKGRNSRSCLLYFDLGDACRRQGQMSSAKTYYRRSLAILETSEPHNNLGEILMAEGDLEGAHAHFRAALALGPSPMTCNNLGLVLSKLARYDEAIVCLNEGLSFSTDVLTPDVEAAIRYSLAKAYAMVGRAESARRQAEKGIKLIEQGYGPPAAAQELSLLMEKRDKPPSREPVSP